MARYQRLFDVFGPTAIGQTVAAVVIGGLIGFGGSRKMHVTDTAGTIGWTLSGAALGFVAALLLVLMERLMARRRKRVEAGLAKPRSVLFWILIWTVLGVVGIFALFVVNALI